jgi:hypothetical protein
MERSSSNVRFVPVDASGIRMWTRVRRLDWIDDIPMLPIADSELLNLPHYCPVAIVMERDGPQVVCVVGGPLLRRRKINDDGQWAGPYAPLALRSLPFRMVTRQRQRIVEIAPMLSDGGAPLAIYTDAGGPAPEFAKILAMLDRVARGSARLANAAKLLLAADLLVPLAHEGTTQKTSLLVVSPNRLTGLSAERAAVLTADGCTALNLAAASLLSQRHWAPDLNADEAVSLTPVANLHRSAGVEPRLADTLDHPFRMDDSALFSFDDYLEREQRSET